MIQSSTSINVIKTLVSQHDELRAMLKSLDNHAGKIEKNYEDILIVQNKFKELLVNHLHFEDEIFYPQLINGERLAGISEEKISTTLKFVEEMQDIGKIVFAFLDKYSSLKLLEENKDAYSNDLSNVTSSLILRMESEEDGVYLEWEFYGPKAKK